MADKRRGRKKVLEKLPKNTVLTDVAKVQWQIVEAIGEGGFGVIYSVKKVCSSAGSNTAYVAKVEPHSNGPLFVEKNFFMRNLQPAMIKKYKQQKKLQFLGLPEYLGGGTHTEDGVQHRFLVMERFGDNINKKLTTTSTSHVEYKLLGKYCSQIIDSLMYIHDKGYAHMDVKPENLLLKYKSMDDKVYLIDFGIIDRCTTNKQFTPDKKRQHNGTTLYTSRDSHQGVVTKRGDLEILGYNILQWCGIELPWSKDIKTPVRVQEKKNQFISNIREELTGKVPTNLIEYFIYITTLKHDDTPAYDYIKSLLLDMDQKNTSAVQQKKTNAAALLKRRALYDENEQSDGEPNTKSSARPAVSPRKNRGGRTASKAALSEPSNLKNDTTKVAAAAKVTKENRKLKESQTLHSPPKRRGRSAKKDV